MFYELLKDICTMHFRRRGTMGTDSTSFEFLNVGSSAYLP
jgi:hypothetical protein